MERMAISKFKATCLAVLEEVRRTGQGLVVTRRGVPVATVLPPPPVEATEGWLGSMRGRGQIVGDLMEPVVPADDWHALVE